MPLSVRLSLHLPVSLPPSLSLFLFACLAACLRSCLISKYRKRIALITISGHIGERGQRHRGDANTQSDAEAHQVS